MHPLFFNMEILFIVTASFMVMSSAKPKFLTPSEDDHVGTTLARCSSSLYDLTVCMAEEKSILFEIKKCDGLLAQTLLCLSTGDEVSYAHEQDEAEENGDQFVVKRGLGRCINQCLNGQGRMNFIQCKSMCHK
ncbi:hypothetical protein DPMN_037643 [Dreissena polymorpha]|uniref:Uncharacterized protein n=1 Tax=Dreissena polymorpha TaxID=45954 RepID=A0A9D4MBQ5_DREPO|nr:hypothetical protein DPMN_037643 [Dreissena polymorpha]